MDEFFKKEYNSKEYNCAHFVADLWEYITGDDIRHILNGFLLPAKDRFVSSEIRHQFEKLEKPVNPCIVLMQRPRTAPHVGLWFNGKVFHIQKDGPQYQPLDVATLGFKTHRFYDVKKDSIS